MPYFATDDGVDLYFEERGTGPPVVLVHGFAANRRFFREQVNELARSRRVVSVDLRGHGDSTPTERGLRLPQYADDLRQLVGYLGLEAFDVLAWAMGGKVVLDYVDQFGDEDLRRLCLVEVTPKTISEGDWQGRADEYDHAENLDNLQSMVYDWEGYVERFYVPYVFAPGFADDHPDVFEWAADQVKDTVPHVAIHTWISSSARDYRPVLPEVSVPCLLARGGESQLYDPAVADYLTDRLPDARAVEFPGAGHALQLESPGPFNEELADFFG